MKRLKLFNVKMITVMALSLLILSPNHSFSQEIGNKNDPRNDSLARILVTDFLEACNSGNRETMENFIVDRYDQNIIKRIPLFAVVTLNMSLYYESGGLGYDLIDIQTITPDNLSVILHNKLTEVKIQIKIPVSPATPPKIVGFIKSESINDTSQIKKFNESELLKRFDIGLKRLQNDEEFSGTILIAKDGEPIFSKSIGDANKDFNIPNKTDTKFNVASVGKLFTSIAILQLAEKGLLSLDDPISDYVPSDWLDTTISKKIQIKHLLTHTSGLGDYFKKAYNQWEVPTFREINDYKSLIADDVLQFEPGSRFSYSNTGFILLGVIIENVTNDNYFHSLKENIFEPIGMYNTDGYDKDYAVISRATGYTKVYENDLIRWNNHQFTRILRGSPSGGIYSTAEDLLLFANAIESNKLLPSAYDDFLMTGKHELNVSFHSYAFFISNGAAGRIASHKGDGRGTNCHFIMYLDSGYTFIILSNYSAPSANIVENIIEQLMINMSAKI